MIAKTFSAVRLTALGLTAVLCAAPALAANRAPEPAKPVDAAKFYSGTWIEIGRLPMKLTDGCVAGTTEYQLKDPAHVAVRDTCRGGSPTGKLKAIGGPIEILDPGTNAKLRVRYHVIGPIGPTWDYWVLDHDDDYRWFISADPSFDKLWIYTRETRPDPALLKTLVEKAKALGYDPSRLEFPAQP